MGIIVVWLVCLIACGILASNKGRSVGGWLLLGALLGPIALILAAVVSSRKAAAAASAAQPETLRKCPYCAEHIQPEAILCRYCGKDVPPVVVPRIVTTPAATQSLSSATGGWLWVAIISVVAALVVAAILGSEPPLDSQGTQRPMSDTESNRTVSATQAASTSALQATTNSHKAYVVKTKEHPIRGGKKDVMLNLIYGKSPSVSAAYAAVGAEIATYVVANRDPGVDSVSGYAQVGDPEKPDSWIQLHDTPKDYIWAWYDSKTNAVIKHFATRDVMVPNVLTGAAADAIAEGER